MKSNFIFLIALCGLFTFSSISNQQGVISSESEIPIETEYKEVALVEKASLKSLKKPQATYFNSTPQTNSFLPIIEYRQLVMLPVRRHVWTMQFLI